MEQQQDSIDLLRVGNLLGGAAQVPRQDKEGKTGGTFYSTFINLSDMEFALIYRLENKRFIRLDLKSEFKKGKPQRIALESL